MIAPLQQRTTSHAKAATKSTSTGADADATEDAAEVADERLAVQKQRFDFATQERAEFEREREALDALVMAALKNEDEVLKKWIEMI